MKRNKSILIIDDELSVLEILTDILAQHYEEVIPVSSPTKAKEIIKDRTFSMIISDINMPELMGDQLVRYVRSFGRLEPIIYVTGHSSRELLLSAIRLGVSDVIEKPFDELQLLESIDRIFELEKRKKQLYAATLIAESKTNDPEVEGNLARQKKIVGLLHVISEQKKT